jgi:hypothetical protein
MLQVLHGAAVAREYGQIIVFHRGPRPLALKRRHQQRRREYRRVGVETDTNAIIYSDYILAARCAVALFEKKIRIARIALPFKESPNAPCL